MNVYQSSGVLLLDDLMEVTEQHYGVFNSRFFLLYAVMHVTESFLDCDMTNGA